MALGVDIAIIIPSKQRWSGAKKGEILQLPEALSRGAIGQKGYSARYTLTGPHLPAPFNSNLIQNAKLLCPVSFYLRGCG